MLHLICVLWSLNKLPKHIQSNLRFSMTSNIVIWLCLVVIRSLSLCSKVFAGICKQTLSIKCLLHCSKERSHNEEVSNEIQTNWYSLSQWLNPPWNRWADRRSCGSGSFDLEVTPVFYWHFSVVPSRDLETISTASWQIKVGSRLQAFCTCVNPAFLSHRRMALKSEVTMFFFFSTAVLSLATGSILTVLSCSQWNKTKLSEI